MNSIHENMPICPVCKKSSSIKRTWRAGYQYGCQDCCVLFNALGVGVTLAPRTT